MDRAEVAWCAGFIDGEGHFCLRGRTPSLSVPQVVEEPILHLRRVLGVGLVSGPHPRKPPRQPVWKWEVHGYERVQHVMAACWPWLHVKRPQAYDVFRRALLDPPRNTNRLEGWLPRDATHCAVGHEFTVENTYIWNGHRSCRKCSARRTAETRAPAGSMCVHPECTRYPQPNGFCNFHHEEWNAARGRVCIIDDCPRGQVAKGLCRKHYSQSRSDGIAPALRTHCPQGHEYTSENTYVNPKRGSRTCKTCQKEAQIKYQERLLRGEVKHRT